jgi:hypothetical protein
MKAASSKAKHHEYDKKCEVAGENKNHCVLPINCYKNTQKLYEEQGVSKFYKNPLVEG